MITPKDGSTFASHSAWLTLSGQTLSINTQNTNLESKEHKFTFQGKITRNGSDLLSTDTYEFSITLLQQACSDGTYTLADVTEPKFGSSLPGVSMATDGSSVVISAQDFYIASTNIYEMAPTFG